MKLALYYLGLATLFTHELDAVRHREWRLFYALRDMAESDAYPIFLFAHVPLFALVIWLSHHPRRAVREGFRLLFASFLVFHAGLHLHLSDHPRYAFEGISSDGLIYSSALMGTAYLALRIRDALA